MRQEKDGNAGVYLATIILLTLLLSLTVNGLILCYKIVNSIYHITIIDYISILVFIVFLTTRSTNSDQ